MLDTSWVMYFQTCTTKTQGTYNHHLSGQEYSQIMAFGATAHPAGTFMQWTWHHIQVTCWCHHEDSDLGNGSWTDGHFQVTRWCHGRRHHIQATWLTSPLRWWPWQQNADVSTGLHSHAPWPCSQAHTVEKSNLCTIKRQHFLNQIN